MENSKDVSNSDPLGGSILIMMALLMVVASMYVTVALFDVRGTVDQERIYRTRKQMTYIQIAVEDYRTNNPSSALTSLSVLVTQPVTLSSCFLSFVSTYTTMQYPRGWCGPYLDTSLFLGTATAYQEDAWGTALSLGSTLSAGSYIYTIRSCGENLTCGDTDDIDVVVRP